VERESGQDEEFLRDFGIEDDIVSFAPLAVAKFSGKDAPHGFGQFIDFQGYEGTYPALAMEEILADSIFVKDPRYRGGAVFKDKIVFVGPIAEIMHDIHQTPFGAMPGVEVHAQLAGALLEGRTLHDAPARTEFWLALAATVVTAALVILLRQAPTQTAAVVVLLGAFAIATQLLFTRGNTVIPVVAPVFALLGIGLFGIVFTFVIEQLEKARIRGVLDQYVSKNVADVVLKYSENFEQMMRGERRNVTVVFSDVRGFTSIFESSDAVALVEQLNEYFQRMVACIQEQAGTLQKFIGDAIMAAWGDTHSLGYGEDAERAVRCALAMREALRDLNKSWEGHPARVPMRTGIGVNHGEVVVGEVGSQGVRKEFTLLGDAVNSAARFESATKQYHVDLLIGGSVEALTRGKFVCRAVDRARFKGKTHPIEVFAVLSDANTPAPAWLGRWHDAIAHFRAARFADAASLFRAVASEFGGEDFLCEMYLSRISEYEIAPPSADWDGAYTLSEK
jgi:adenylate cyclase